MQGMSAEESDALMVAFLADVSRGLTSIAGIAATTKMQAAKPSRNKPAPRSRPGRLDEAAADSVLGATAEQVGLDLPSAFCPVLKLPDCLMHVERNAVCGHREHTAEALHSTWDLDMRRIVQVTIAYLIERGVPYKAKRWTHTRRRSYMAESDRSWASAQRQGSK